MDRVLVTGANGHVGWNLVQLLVEKGYSVRAAVRNRNDSAKTKPLASLGVELVEADLLKPDTLDSAVKQMDGVFQVAAVYTTFAKNPQKEIIEPSVTGGINVLEAAKKGGVKKVVFTSSVAAVGTVEKGGAPRTEADWNERALDPYTFAKTEAEKRAWEFSRNSGLSMVSILPSAVIGPGFYRHTPSTQMFELLLRGKVPFILPMSLGFVDVRDVARAHVLAYENPRAEGRYICSAWFASVKEVFQIIYKLDPAIKVPTLRLPARLMGVLPALDWMGNKLMGLPRFMTKDFVREYGGRELHCSSDKIRRELGWQPLEFEQSLKDTLDWIRGTFLPH
jgi:dihydroflavonol-4-reductase